MGYTHYWRRQPPGKELPVLKVAKALKGMQVIARAASGRLGIKLRVETSERILGGNRKQLTSILINGVGDDEEFEDFVFPPERDFEFCKTDDRPYDIVVVACLAVAKHYLGDRIEIASDGDHTDWAPGVHFARDTLQLPQLIANPRPPEP